MVNTAIKLSAKCCITIVGQDVDLLVLVIGLCPVDREILLLKPKIGKVQPKVFSTLNIKLNYLGISNFIILAYAFGGCDTTSAIYFKGKKLILHFLASNEDH